jgi:hypothetical protein
LEVVSAFAADDEKIKLKARGSGGTLKTLLLLLHAFLGFTGRIPEEFKEARKVRSPPNTRY